MRLYRPVGQAELDLIAKTNFREYPPRLPEQPIFYPVLNEKYAREIAEKWNKKSADSGYAGYVTTFEIDDAYISQFDIQTVGASYNGIGLSKQFCFDTKSLILQQIFRKNLSYPVAMSVVQN